MLGDARGIGVVEEEEGILRRFEGYFEINFL